MEAKYFIVHSISCYICGESAPDSVSGHCRDCAQNLALQREDLIAEAEMIAEGERLARQLDREEKLKHR